MVLPGLSSPPPTAPSPPRQPGLAANLFAKTARDLAAQTSLTPRRKVSSVEAFSWYKVGKFGHRKVQNATTDRARNSSQKLLNAFVAWLLEKYAVLCTDLTGGGSGPPFLGVLPASISFPRLCTSFPYPPREMLQCFLARGPASSLNYKNPLQGLTQLLIKGSTLLALNLLRSFAKLPSTRFGKLSINMGEFYLSVNCHRPNCTHRCPEISWFD